MLSEVSGNFEILVFSDTHGSASLMKKALADHPDADVIFLGDGLADLNFTDLSGRNLIAAAGNCDDLYNESRSPEERVPQFVIADLHGVKTYITHGAHEGVKYGFGFAAETACRCGCDLLLFGHTHRMTDEYLTLDRTVHIFNPGSAGRGLHPSYGLLTFRDGKMLTSHFSK